MSNEDRKQLPKLGLADSKSMFGSPPVLSSESVEHYDGMWDQLTAHFMPIDIVELMLIKNLVDGTWELQRYVRQRTLSVERRFRQSQEFQQKRVEDIQKRRDSEIRDLAQKMGVPPDDFLQKCQLDSELEQILRDTTEIFERIPTELDHARALESAIGYHEQLERLINGSLRRRDSTLELLDHYRTGLGQRLRKESDKIIDAASIVFEEQSQQIKAPSVVPSDAEGTAS